MRLIDIDCPNCGCKIHVEPEPEPKWIPCSERLPQKDGRYMITGKTGIVYSYDFADGRWYGGIKPVAWMPLPEPYTEEST